MPAWMTSELREDVSVPIPSLASRTITSRPAIANARATANPTTPAPNTTTTGAWYFYNPSTVSFGAGEFTKKWGSRKLEDNWRRLDKDQNMALDVEGANSDQDSTDTNGNVIYEVVYSQVIDNLLKGAVGQAVQNMNLLFGLEEGTGLQLKANYF